MTKWSGALSAELLKLKGTGIFWLSTVGTVSTNLMIAGLAWYLPQVTDQVSPQVLDNTEAWVRFHYDGILPMLLPMYIVILCALSVLLENKNHAWQRLYALPVPKPVIYVSKLLIVLFAFSFSHGLFWVLMMLIPELAGIGLSGSGLSFSLTGNLMIITIISSAGILGMMFWVSYFSRGFVLPLAAGIVGFVIAQLLSDYNMNAFWFPFSHPRLAVASLLDDQQVRIDVVLGSLLCFLLFLGAGVYQSARDFRIS